MIIIGQEQPGQIVEFQFSNSIRNTKINGHSNTVLTLTGISDHKPLIDKNKIHIPYGTYLFRGRSIEFARWDLYNEFKILGLVIRKTKITRTTDSGNNCVVVEFNLLTPGSSSLDFIIYTNWTENVFKEVITKS
jgi:hypothetical protein